MKTYLVTIPLRGAITYSVTADTAAEAMAKVDRHRSGDLEVDGVDNRTYSDHWANGKGWARVDRSGLNEV